MEHRPNYMALLEVPKRDPAAALDARLNWNFSVSRTLASTIRNCRPLP
jgi:hypothetical protein